jgi:hypothetical protein
VSPDSSRRGRGGRFLANSDLLTRYKAIAAVLRFVDPERPQSVSIRRFDAARGAAGYESLPHAQSLAKWLGAGWAEVKIVALDDERHEVRTYTSRHRAPPRPWLDRDGAIQALRRVAEALGQGDLSAVEYDAYRESCAAATRELLPTSAQVVKLFGGWASALREADLSRSLASVQEAGVQRIEAVSLFVRTQGRRPRRKELEAFARDPRWAFPLRNGRGRPWESVLDDFETLWVGELHRWMPPASESRPFIPLRDEDIAELRLRTRAPKGWWNRARVIECVVSYFEDNPEVPNLRQPSYRAWAKIKTAQGIWAAAPSTLTKYGTLSELEIEARARVRGSRAGS